MVSLHINTEPDLYIIPLYTSATTTWIVPKLKSPSTMVAVQRSKVNHILYYKRVKSTDRKDRKKSCLSWTGSRTDCSARALASSWTQNAPAQGWLPWSNKKHKDRKKAHTSTEQTSAQIVWNNRSALPVGPGDWQKAAIGTKPGRTRFRERKKINIKRRLRSIYVFLL